jgi:FlaA1/EpsC-like NDP-sugar epimerase
LSPAFAAWIIGVSDFCLVLVAAAGAFAAHYDVVERAGSGRHLLTAFLAATLFVNGFERFGGYRLKQLLNLSWQVRRILLTWGVLVSALLLIAFLAKISDSFSRGWVLGWIVAAVGMQLTGRCILKIATQPRLRKIQFARNVVILGAGEEGQRLVAKLHRSQDNSIVIHGIFDDRQSRVPRTIDGFIY